MNYLNNTQGKIKPDFWPLGTLFLLPEVVTDNGFSQGNSVPIQEDSCICYPICPFGT